MTKILFNPPGIITFATNKWRGSCRVREMKTLISMKLGPAQSKIFFTEDPVYGFHTQLYFQEH